MSLVSSYHKASDGLYYEGPWRDERETWFICLDDDDPPELVVFLKEHPELRKMKKGMKSLREWVKENIPFSFYVFRYCGESMRIQGVGKKARFADAISMFGLFEGFPPPPDLQVGKKTWEGSLQRALCPNHGSFDGPLARCSCGKCENGWI